MRAINKLIKDELKRYELFIHTIPKIKNTSELKIAVENNIEYLEKLYDKAETKYYKDKIYAIINTMIHVTHYEIRKRND